MSGSNVDPQRCLLVLVSLHRNPYGIPKVKDIIRKIPVPNGMIKLMGRILRWTYMNVFFLSWFWFLLTYLFVEASGEIYKVLLYVGIAASENFLSHISYVCATSKSSMEIHFLRENRYRQTITVSGLAENCNMVERKQTQRYEKSWRKSFSVNYLQSSRIFRRLRKVCHASAHTKRTPIQKDFPRKQKIIKNFNIVSVFIPFFILYNIIYCK